MSRLIVVIQEKGGVGKTFLSVHLTAYLRSLGHVYRPVDFDVASGLVSRIFPAPDSANLSPDPALIRSGESRLPELMERVLAGQMFLIDCGANTGLAWNALFQEAWPDILPQMRTKGIKLTLVVPVGNDEKSRPTFEYYKTLFPGATQVMVIKREYPDEVFELPRHPAELQFDLPLAPGKLLATYRQRGLSIDDIAAATNDVSLKFVRSFAVGYLPRLHAAFDKIKPHLLP